MQLSGFSNISQSISKSNTPEKIKINKENESNLKNIESENDDLFNLKNKTIGQIKNVNQEKQPEQNTKNEENNVQSIMINSFDDLLKVCALKKEIKLKYELEKNVNLVSFVDQRIEISFNENLDKEFIKIISLKLYEWTGNRWIITLSKKRGAISIKEKEKFFKKNNLDKVKKGSVYKKVLDSFPDAELIDIENQGLEND